jgi:5-hydroxyisourate hydrolase
MKSISTHVLDTSRGRPAAGVPVRLERDDGGGRFTVLCDASTDADGRVKGLVPEGQLTAGTFRVRFDTGAYFAAQGVEAFYPEAVIMFVVKDAAAHYHVPLLLAPYAYSTYRGS